MSTRKWPWHLAFEKWQSQDKQASAQMMLTFRDGGTEWGKSEASYEGRGQDTMAP